jgi:hypothetical protein
VVAQIVVESGERLGKVAIPLAINDVQSLARVRVKEPETILLGRWRGGCLKWKDGQESQRQQHMMSSMHGRNTNQLT